MKRSRIALFGIFGVQNLGNECTLQAMIYNVRKRLPGAELHSICYEPQDTSRRHGVTALPVSAMYSRNGASGRPSRRRNMLANLFRIFFQRAPVELRDWLRAFKVLKGTNLMVMTGTGMLTDCNTSSFGFPYDVFKWATVAKLAGCKVRFVGIGVGPIYDGLSRCFIKAALTRADYRSYRDDVSRTRLGKFGFQMNEDRVLPDLAFSLPRHILPECSNQKQRHVVGLGVMDYIDRHLTRQDERKATYEAYLNKMCDFAEWLIGHSYGVRILQGDAKYDGVVRRDLRSKMESRGLRYEERGIIDEDSTSVEDLLAQLAVTDVVVSPRFHNLILALMLNKPVISISYDSKSDVLLEGFGLGRYTQPMASLDVQKLIDQFVDLEARTQELRPLLRKKVEEYRSLLDEQYGLVLSNL